MNTPKQVVFVVDDDASFVTAMARLLRAGNYEFRTFSSATEFLKQPPLDQPGCVIVDLHMPGPSGLDLQDALAKTDNPLPVIFLTGHGDIPTSVHAVKQGAEDFLTKPVKRDVLFAAIERAFVRDTQERRQRARRRELFARFDTLTPREREVLGHVVRGQLNKQIAGDLDASERTIKAHRANIMAKLQVRSVAELVRLTQEARIGDEDRGVDAAALGESSRGSFQNRYAFRTRTQAAQAPRAAPVLHQRTIVRLPLPR